MAKNPKRQTYWRLVMGQFRKSRASVFAFFILLSLAAIAFAAPFIAHENPLYLHLDGKTYWLTNVIDYEDLRDIYFDEWEAGPNDRAIYPPAPYPPQRSNLRRMLEGPSADHWLGTDDRGRDVFSRVVWGTRISMTIGFVAVGISLAIGVVIGALGGFYGGKVDAVVLRLIEIMLCFPTLILILDRKSVV